MAMESIVPLLEPGTRCAMIFPDGGEGYLRTAYDDAWVERELKVSPGELEHLAGLDRSALRAA